MSGVYINAFCCACHKLVMVPDGDRVAALQSIGWHFTEKDNYCSTECLEAGATVVVRERVNVQGIRWDRKTKAAYKTGAYAAIDGFDCVSADPEYVRGHAFGMSLRDIAKQFAAEIEKRKS